MQQVTIHIITTQEIDGQSDTMETMLVGTVQHTPTAVILHYREVDEEHNTFDTTLRIDTLTKRVQMDKLGASESHMTVEKGRRHHNIYNLGPCDFDLGVYGEQVDFAFSPEGGHIEMRYTLDINGTDAGRNTIKINLKGEHTNV